MLTPNLVGNTSTDSDPDSTGLTVLETLTSGEENDTYDAGFIPDFDLALIIDLAEEQDLEVQEGDTVCFNIEIFNQGIADAYDINIANYTPCLLYTSPSPRDQRGSRMPSSA